MVAQKVVLRRVGALQVTWLACLIGTIACLPFAGQLLGDLTTAPGLSDPVERRLPRSGARRLSAFSTWAYALSRHHGREAGCHHVRGAADHHRARLAVAR